MKLPSPSSTFRPYNSNPKGKRTSDCVYRALSVAMTMDWGDVLQGLCNLAIKRSYAPNDPKLYGAYLEQNGYVKCKQPKKTNGSKYTANEFATWILNVTKKPVIAHVGGHHVAVFVDGKLVDTFNCGSKCVGNYWVLPSTQQGQKA